MPRQCLFCENRVDSAEHVWSDWILKDLNPVEPLRRQIGKHTDVWSDNPEVLVRCVCQKCNNGWMSDLEAKNKPLIHAMINDEPCALSGDDQTALTRWVLMKAMVLDVVNSKRRPFYSTEEKTEIKSGLSIPLGNLVWLGRLSVKAFHAGGTDVWADIDQQPKGFHGCVTTIVIGHLIIQVFTGHLLQQRAIDSLRINCKEGAWDISLLDIWPVAAPLRWPPSLSFTLRGPNPIRGLIKRWKIGQEVG